MRNDWMLRPKGVPYQVARSGAKVVSVFPVAVAIDAINYGVLRTSTRWVGSSPSCRRTCSGRSES